MKKSVWKMALTVIMILLVAVINKETTVAESSDNDHASIKIYIDGELIDFEGEPVLVEGTTLVPFRVLFQKLGYSVDWDSAERKVMARKAGQSIDLPVDGKNAVVNGQPLAMAVPPFILDGKTYVPLRFVAEQTGREASWDATTREICIADTANMIAHVLDKHLTAFVAGDRPAFVRTLTADAAAHITRETEGPTADPLQVSFTSRLLEQKADQAMVEVVLVIHERRGGLHAADSHQPLERTTSHYRMVREGGEWKVDNHDVQWVEHLAGLQSRESEIADLEGLPAWSDKDRLAILDVLEQSRRDLESGNVETPVLHELAVQLGEVDGWVVSPGEVVVSFSMLVQKVSGPFHRDYVLVNEATMIKAADGAWKVASIEWLVRDYRMERIVDFLEGVRG